MDKKEYGSYEDVHAMLVEAMQEACTKDESGQYQSPNIDMSFLYEEVAPQKKKPVRTNRFTKVAAIIIMVLLGMNVVMLATDSGEVYSEKGLLHRIYEGARGIFTDEDQSIYLETNETGREVIIDDMTEINYAKQFWSNLYVPQYLPENFDLESLTISKDIEGEYNANYIFSNSDKKIIISIFSYNGDNKPLSNDSDIIRNSQKIVSNLYLDNAYESYTIDLYMEKIFVCIYGNIDKKELIKISNNLL